MAKLFKACTFARLTFDALKLIISPISVERWEKSSRDEMLCIYSLVMLSCFLFFVHLDRKYVYSILKSFNMSAVPEHGRHFESWDLITN